MAKKIKLIDGGTINGALTFYLYGLYSVRRGRLSAAEAMDHVLGLGAAAQDAKRSMGRLTRRGTDQKRE